MTNVFGTPSLWVGAAAGAEGLKVTVLSAEGAL